MKEHFRYILIILATHICFPAGAQLMRIALLPQSMVKITPHLQPVLMSLGIDYYRMEPNGAPGGNQPAYNRVLSAADVVVKINNKLSHKTFQSLVEGDNALLLLHPLSKEKVHAELNMANPESQGVESIEVDILAPVVIGYNQADADISQNRLIFRNFGLQLNNTEYFNRAICLDLLQQSGKLLYNAESFELQPDALSLCNKLYRSTDFLLFPPRDLRSLIAGGFITINDSAEITRETITRLQSIFVYQQAIAATQTINMHWKTQHTQESKTEFYSTSTHLLTFGSAADNSGENTGRYLRMLAWKTRNFVVPEEGKQYIVKRNDSVFYRAAPVFFNSPFFMMLASEFDQWLRSHPRIAADAAGERDRLMQLLGLPPGSGNDLFVEMWVKKEDFFRPGLDSSLSLGGMMTNIDSTYLKSFLAYSSGSFSAPLLLKKYPFTGLGYTWDWNPDNATHVGLNEFVLKEGREIYISKTYPTDLYIDKVLSAR